MGSSEVEGRKREGGREGGKREEWRVEEERGGQRLKESEDGDRKMSEKLSYQLSAILTTLQSFS